MPDTSLRDIVDFRVGLSEGWYPLPLSSTSSAEWSIELAAELVIDPEVRGRLAGELDFARTRLSSMNNPRLTAAIWVPYPETGRASAAVVFELTPVAALGSPEVFEEFLQSYTDREESGLNYYSVRTWRSTIAVGELVGSHNLIAHATDGPEGAVLEERAVVAVFPPGAAQAVQFIFSAESLGAFVNMPRETQEFVETLALTLGAAV
ncbi:hypothetical protein [Frigoribacterium sp. UYMn621]|jgi:hypothetical protein|uniref:hypothetical protein n=1 Tax=Frigoribacterium sp. UYMn621 TaxID=3156343 RepID=UPI0033983D03